jgi:UDP-3-O-[3-hydroxymyristoyl] glucosamine N-acyltransferase
MKRQFFCVNAKKYDSNKDYVVTAASSLNKPESNTVMFCTEEHMGKIGVLMSIENCIVFWPEKTEIPKNIRLRHVIIAAPDPRQAYAMFFLDNGITYYPEPSKYQMRNGAYIAEGAQIGENVVLFPGTYIDSQVVIGDGCYIGSGVKLLGNTRLGKNVIVRENAVIGADGLSTMRKPDGGPATIPQFGGVVLEDEVQIGANTVIARGSIDDTIIHHGAKIDNLCFISHNVQVGVNTFIVGETIMFGSSSTGVEAYISGNSSIREGVHVGEKSFVGMGSVVVESVPNGAIVMGNPARQYRF